MDIAEHQWCAPPEGRAAASTCSRLERATGGSTLVSLYRRLADGHGTPADAQEASEYLRAELQACEAQPRLLPHSPFELQRWMQAQTRCVTTDYGSYLAQRRAGAPRRFFSNRAHALHFLRAVAPTKLVDGAWLYGLLPHWRNARFAHLVRTYVEELGEGVPALNHVLIYRRLLSRHGLELLDDLAPQLYRPGLLQLALGCNGEAFLPEVIGFNLAYEQLPLHLLISAYELNELGIDPYYFTLHVTVDNAGSGHAMRACQAVIDTVPRGSGAGEFWRRVGNGARLAEAGPGTQELIDSFDIEAEVVRIFANRSNQGHGAHSDYCAVAGRKVNDWLAQPQQIPAFLQALQASGWVERGRPVDQSRFWRLLQGERPEMFGVFSGYELQVIHDWIRGDASTDGRPYCEPASAPERPRRQSYRAQARLAQAGACSGGALGDPQTDDRLDPDLKALKAQLPRLDAAGQMAALVAAMAPSNHWTPAGLHATRLFWERARG